MPELPQTPAAVTAPASPLAAVVAARLAALAAAGTPRRRLVAGVSGGVDSLLLLDLLRELSPLPLLAVHVHHGLSPRADDWAAQVEQFCRARQLPCAVRRVRVDRARPSLEAAARAARHAVFAEVLEPGDALLLAHHADDQAETLLLRLLRGSGLGGLGAIREARPLAAPADCVLWRPLLALRRADIVAEAQRRGLRWVEDESNADRSLDRNFLRHEVLPVLATRWPAVAEVLARTARRLADSDALLNEYLDAELQQSFLRSGAGGPDGLDAAAIAAASPARRRALLRRWLARIGAPLFSAAWLEEVAALAASRIDAEGELRVGGWEVHRYRGVLLAFPALPPAEPERVLAWDGRGRLELGAGSGVLVGCPTVGPTTVGPTSVGHSPPLPLAIPPDTALSIRFRRGGERFAPAGGSGHRPLKKILQERGVPPWLRDRIPLLYAGEQIAAIGDVVVAAGFAPGPDRPATHHIHWHSP